MDSFGLPMSFGKKAKGASDNLSPTVDRTRLDEPVCPVLPSVFTTYRICQS